jgi:hypothetical protein
MTSGDGLPPRHLHPGQRRQSHSCKTLNRLVDRRYLQFLMERRELAPDGKVHSLTDSGAAASPSSSTPTMYLHLAGRRRTSSLGTRCCARSGRSASSGSSISRWSSACLKSRGSAIGGGWSRYPPGLSGSIRRRRRTAGQPSRIQQRCDGSLARLAEADPRLVGVPRSGGNGYISDRHGLTIGRDAVVTFRCSSAIDTR